MLPIPPRTAAVKAFIPAIKPMRVDDAVELAEQYPATAAITAPMTKVSEITDQC